EKVPYDEAEPRQPSEPGPLLNGAWYPSATELGNGNVISFGGLNEQGSGATSTNYYIAPYNKSDTAGDKPGQWVGWGSDELQQTYDWFWGLYPSMILTADGRLFYDGSHVFGDGLESKKEDGEESAGATPAPEGSAIYDFYCTPGKSAKEEESEQRKTNPNAQVSGPRVAGGPASEDETHPRVQSTPGLKHPDLRDQSASLLLPPAQAQKVMILGGGNTYETGRDATDSTQEIDLMESDPQWKEGPDLPRGRLDDGELEPQGAGKMYVSAVALPDGTVLETGGSLLPRTKDVHEASIFNPASNEFSPVAADPVGRDYHSEALLLPDGDVMTLGSNPVNVGAGTEGFQTAISIYEPPYMFKGERPRIAAIDGQLNRIEGDVNKTAQWEYGSEHTISYTSKAHEITSAVLIRPAAVTHSSDPNQREVTLPITGASGPAGEAKSLQISLTSNPNLAPPGYYMAFLVNSEGVPSEAQWVHVGPQGNPEDE
ncbi:MAG TPA: galactose oxidase early set domain-containing protein, partial [Solirubrobacteraceae bacterium]|nr:galactose oxidase early set domain-containing protein [Solirubrobacteraceae bacterium]